MSQLTKQERREIAEALKAAKPLLATTYEEWESLRKSEFICSALNEVRDGSLPCSEGATAARRVIAQRLDGHGHVNSFIMDHLIRIGVDGDEAHEIAYRKEGADLVQEYRHLWVDALIKEFSR